MSEKIDFEFFILAGESQAEGMERASLPWTDGLTLIEAVEIRFDFAKPKIVREDLIKGLGPLGGIYTALKSTQKDWNIIASCDMPFLTTATLGKLLDQLKENPNAKAAFVALEERPPFPCFLHREMLDAVQKLLRQGKRDLFALADKFPQDVAFLPVPDTAEEHEFFEIHTEADYERAKIWAGV